MLARSLSAQQTQVLFLPEQMVSYQAFECDENGNGISLIEKSKFWSTIRMVLTMAHYLNELDGCVKQKTIRVKGDPNDTRPLKTIEKVVDATHRKVRGQIRYDATGPSTLIDSLHRANTKVEWEGFDQGGMPDIRVDMEEERKSTTPVNSEMLELSRRMQMQDFFIAPSFVDESVQPEFAATLARENDLTARTISKFIKTLGECNKDFICKYTQFDENLIQKCFKVIEIKGTKKDGVETIDGVTLIDKKIEIIQSTLNKMTVSTPVPDQNRLDASKESLDNVTSVLETVFDYALPDNLSDLREVGEYFPLIKANIKADAIKKYLQTQPGIPSWLSRNYRNLWFRGNSF